MNGSIQESQCMVLAGLDGRARAIEVEVDKS